MTTIQPKGPFTIDDAKISNKEILDPDEKEIGHILLTTTTPQLLRGVVMGSDAYLVPYAYTIHHGDMEKFLRYLISCSEHESFDLAAHVPRIKRILGEP